MRFRNTVTGLVVSTERQLGYPYERVDEIEIMSWASEEPVRSVPVVEHVCHCGRGFSSEQGLAQHQRMAHSDEEE